MSSSLLARMKALDMVFDGALEGDETSVHDARVAARRLHEALRVAGSAGARHHAGRAANETRRIRRDFGPLREVHVAIGVLLKAAASQPWRPAVVAEIRWRFEQMAAAGLRRQRQKLEATDVSALRRQVADLARTVADAPRLKWERALVKRVEARRRNLADVVAAVGAWYVVERLHRVRVAAKKLRYTCELIGEATGVDTRRAVAALKAMQAELGQIQDLHVLQEHLRTATGGATASRAVDAASVRRMIRGCERECRRLHAGFLADTARRSGELDRALRRVRLACGVPRRVARGAFPSSRRAAAALADHVA